MKAKQCAAPRSTLRQPNVSACDDSPHRSVHLPKHLPNREVHDADIRTLDPLDGDVGLTEMRTFKTSLSGRTIISDSTKLRPKETHSVPPCLTNITTSKMKAKQRAAPSSTLRQPNVAVCDDSPHRSVHVLKHLSNCEAHDADIRTLDPLGDEVGLAEMRTLGPTMDDGVEYSEDIAQDYELPLRGGEHSTQTNIRKPSSMETYEDEREVDQHSSHFELNLDDSGLQSLISEISMDDWFEDLNQAQLSPNGLLGKLPSEDDLMDAFHKTFENVSRQEAHPIALVRRKDNHSHRLLLEAKVDSKYDVKDARHQRKNCRSQIRVASPNRPGEEMTRSIRPSVGSDVDQLILNHPACLHSSDSSFLRQNPLKKASPEVVSIYVSSSEWKSRQRLRSEWSEFVKCKRRSRPTPRLTEGVMLNEYPRPHFHTTNHSSPKLGRDRDYRQSGTVTHPSRRVCTRREEASDAGMKQYAPSSHGFSEDAITPPDLGLDSSEIKKRRKILQKTMSMRRTRNLDSE